MRLLADKERQLLLKEKEIEVEDKLNTLIALNEKLEVFNDLKKDVKENQTFVITSEAAREKLQVTITETADKLNEDTKIKEQYQEMPKSLISMMYWQQFLLYVMMNLLEVV